MTTDPQVNWYAEEQGTTTPPNPPEDVVEITDDFMTNKIFIGSGEDVWL
jgi:hypothetical protein